MACHDTASGQATCSVCVCVGAGGVVCGAPRSSRACPCPSGPIDLSHRWQSWGKMGPKVPHAQVQLCARGCRKECIPLPTLSSFSEPSRCQKTACQGLRGVGWESGGITAASLWLLENKTCPESRQHSCSYPPRAGSRLTAA